jgi:alpha-tubulin suppressor-like RCC1 family protein
MLRLSRLLGIVLALALYAVPAHGATSARAPSSGTVWTWGIASSGTFGAATFPAPMLGLRNVIEVAASPTHRLALAADGTVWAWGNNRTGQLGDGTTQSSDAPMRVSELSRVIAIAAPSDGWAIWSMNLLSRKAGVKAPARKGLSGAYSLALTADGRVWAWGSDGTNKTFSDVPLLIHFPGDKTPTITAIAAGPWDALALDSTGAVWQWSTDPGLVHASPALVDGLHDIRKIAAAWDVSVAVDSAGNLWEWPRSGSQPPARVPGPSVGAAKQLVFGANLLVLLRNGTVWQWGPHGRHTVRFAKRFVGVADGNSVLGLCADGTVWTWDNLEDWGTGAPRQVRPLKSVMAIAAGYPQNLAIVRGPQP